MKRELIRILLVGTAAWLASAPLTSTANPPDVKVVFQAFWWDCLNRNYQTDGDGTGGWYTYLAKLCPRLRDMGFDGIWIPPPCKAASGRFGMGYDLFDHYDLGQKFQHGTTGTRFGDQDAFLRLIAVAHACGLEVYPDIVLNHLSGGAEDPTAPGNRFKTFQYRGFAGAAAGRWPKGRLDFHPNPHHASGGDEWRQELFGPDVCYHGRCCDNDCDHAGTYMRDRAREWLTWLRKQTDADGFRFDAVKHFPPEIVEDLLFNAMDIGRPEPEQRHYFAVGEYVVGRTEQSRIDQWAGETKNRCGTFDFAFREALLDLVKARGFFDLGSLPGFQQRNRLKTVPFVNNHDTWRGYFSDSSGNGREDHIGDLKNGDELLPTLDPDDDWARVAYAAAMAVDGSPQIYYEDLFRNNRRDTRERSNPTNLVTRAYVENLLWCHQKLNFKDGAYKVRFQGSPDLLVIERSGRAVIGLNDNGAATLPDQPLIVETDFGANVPLHDYSGATAEDQVTDAQGRIRIRVPPKSYCVWGPQGVRGGFAGHPRRTIQEFQMDDDLGDANSHSLRYGGKIVPKSYRTGGAVWVARNSTVNVSVYADQSRSVSLRVYKPASKGDKATSRGRFDAQGPATATAPLALTFVADREGYHQFRVKLDPNNAMPVRGYIKVEYEAPATSDKF